MNSRNKLLFNYICIFIAFAFGFCAAYFLVPSRNIPKELIKDKDCEKEVYNLTKKLLTLEKQVRDIDAKISELKKLGEMNNVSTESEENKQQSSKATGNVLDLDTVYKKMTKYLTEQDFSKTELLPEKIREVDNKLDLLTSLINYKQQNNLTNTDINNLIFSFYFTDDFIKAAFKISENEPLFKELKEISDKYNPKEILKKDLISQEIDRNSILVDYLEFFKARGKEGRSKEAILGRLGTIRSIFDKLLTTNRYFIEATGEVFDRDSDQCVQTVLSHLTEFLELDSKQEENMRQLIKEHYILPIKRLIDEEENARSLPDYDKEITPLYYKVKKLEVVRDFMKKLEAYSILNEEQINKLKTKIFYYFCNFPQ